MTGARWYRWLVGAERADTLPGFMPWAIMLGPVVGFASLLVWSYWSAR